MNTINLYFVLKLSFLYVTHVQSLENNIAYPNNCNWSFHVKSTLIWDLNISNFYDFGYIICAREIYENPI